MSRCPTKCWQSHLAIYHVTAHSDDDEIWFNWSHVTPPDELNEMLQYLEAWYEAAVRIDQNQAANATFRSAHTSAPQPKPFSAGTNRATPFPSRQNLPSRFVHVVPTPGNPVPMDIDVAKRHGKLPPTCFHCGRPGHVVHDCPQPMDIRTMGRDKADFLMGHLSARMDEINLTSSEVVEDDLPQRVEEDFHSRSKK